MRFHGIACAELGKERLGSGDVALEGESAGCPGRPDAELDALQMYSSASASGRTLYWTRSRAT